MSNASPSRSQALDLVRAVSILWIVGIWHVLDYLPEWSGTRNVVTYHVTVALLGLFTLVSGYLMGRKPIRLDAASIAEFYGRRFARIYPPFVLACLVFGILHFAAWAPLAKAMLLVAMLWGPPPYTLWFIALITLFYAATPFLAALRGRGHAYAAAVLGLTLLLIAAATASPSVSPRLAMYFPAYAAGLWLARAPAAWARIAIVGVAVSLLGLVFSIQAQASLIESRTTSAGWALGAALALFATAMAADQRLPALRWTGFVATASYFLYLFHRVVYAVLLRVVDPADPAVRAALILCVGLPAALLLGWFGQRGYDALWSGRMRGGALRKTQDAAAYDRHR